MKTLVQKLKNQYHLCQALLANIWYGFPSRRLKVIGVTGTDGKTTTTHLIFHLLKACGKRVSMISTVYAMVGDHEYETGLHTTTPDPFLVQSMLKKAADNGDEFFVLETTSHAIDQNRVWGVSYEVGVVTNVTHEHLDYHRDYEDYLATKAILLERSRHAVINRDDESYGRMKAHAKNTPVTYGLDNPADFTEDFRKTVPGLADFNAYNFLAAYATGCIIGLDKKKMRAAIRSFTLPPGRLDMVYTGKFSVMVDFAHTPNAIGVLLQTVRKLYLKKGGRIIHVFGSAGLRDATKRPLMGEASAANADLVILTEEDYRTEDPKMICDSIASGMTVHGFTRKDRLRPEDTKKFAVVIDRKRALTLALSLAGDKDLVVVTGKGHEKSLCRGTVEYPWSDRETILELLKK